MAGDSTRHAPAIYLKSTGKRVNSKPATGIHALSTVFYGNSTLNLGCNELNENRFLYTPIKQLRYPKKKFLVMLIIMAMRQKNLEYNHHSFTWNRHVTDLIFALDALA